jgi:hypothetical protein
MASIVYAQIRINKSAGKGIILAAAAMNFKRMMNKWKEQLVFFALKLLHFFTFYSNLFFTGKLKMTF